MGIDIFRVRVLLLPLLRLEREAKMTKEDLAKIMGDWFSPMVIARTLDVLQDFKDGIHTEPYFDFPVCVGGSIKPGELGFGKKKDGR